MVKRCSWCDESSNRSFMVDPLRCLSFQPVLHNKGWGICYPVSVCVCGGGGGGGGRGGGGS